MTDIFFSYSNLDRERVRPVRDAFAAQGFEVFWDQEVPAGIDWDTWIRQHLNRSKCVVVFWSAASTASDNVRHEATVAKMQGKLIPVLLEPLRADQFPMGLYVRQAVSLAGWSGGDNERWRKLSREVETKLTPPWVRRQIDELEAELAAARARRDGAESRDRVWQAQIAKEVRTQQELQRERDAAMEEAETVKALVEELRLARSDSDARATDSLQRLSELETQRQSLKQERDAALEEAVGLQVTVEDERRARSEMQRHARELLQVQQEFKRQRDEAVEEVAALKRAIEELERARLQSGARAAEPVHRRDGTESRPRPSAKNFPPGMGKQGQTASGERRAIPFLSVVLLVSILGFAAYLTRPTVRTGSETASTTTSARQDPSSAASASPPGRETAAAPTVREPSLPAPGRQYAMRTNMEASGDMLDTRPVKSMDECQRICERSAGCVVFTYRKKIPVC